ncbi:MAG: hypothetical protein DMD96_28590 [Candidatus Rokuibacteriota bacterium]|nr:MAG: hypothetical protein DMD96_28590 [Candidatus Rokubacteria bacterium]
MYGDRSRGLAAHRAPDRHKRCYFCFADAALPEDRGAQKRRRLRRDVFIQPGRARISVKGAKLRWKLTKFRPTVGIGAMHDQYD